jgi:hypothetical protein
MTAFLRALPETLWWVTVFFAVLAFFTQIAISLARSGSVGIGQLLGEFVVTLALLTIPVGVAWRGRQQRSLWYALGAMVLLVAFARIYFF